MTCWFDPDTLDVYDHNGNLVGNVGTDTDFNGTWVSDWPQQTLIVLRNAMEGTKPSAYNQRLIADMASENIERGTPP